MDWITFENNLSHSHFFTIHNNSSKNIVLFGNCHMATIGFFLNQITKKKYNIHIIISWYFDKVGLQNFDMKQINKKIRNLVQDCDIFLCHIHIKDYGVQATTLHQLVSPISISLRIPNIRLNYDSVNESDYLRSLEILHYNLVNSDFPDYVMIIEEGRKIHFFNTPEHPTHYLLYLLSKSIDLKLHSQYPKISLGDYYNQQNRNDYQQILDKVMLPGRIRINERMSGITGIPINVDFFD